MTSFVGDLWKKVNELKFTGKPSSSFPFVFNEQEIVGTAGPFHIFEGQDFETSERREESIFRKVTIFSCKEKPKIEGAKRILKNLKTLRHPRMLRYISSKENETEILIVTEWVEPFKKSNDKELQIWGKWSVSKVFEFLKSATGREICIEEGNLWITKSGEVKVALFNENSSIEDFSTAIKRIFPAETGDKNNNKSLLIELTETFDHLFTLSLGERSNLIKKISTNSNISKDFLKFLVLPELVKSRKLLSTSQQEISIEEVLFLFGKGKELIGEGGVDDFMFLLSDFYCELLGKQATGQQPIIPLTICLLDQMGSQGLCNLFTEKYSQDKIYPQVSVLLGNPLPVVREAALKALQGLCEKLNVKTIGNDVLRQLARLQGDAEGLLRLKALGVLEGTVWEKIPDTLKAKICGPAVSRALADSYPPCKRSGLNLLKKGIGLLPAQEIATKLIPAVAGLLIEEDAGIRKEAFECMEKLILPTLKKVVVTMGKTSATVNSGDASESAKVTANLNSASNSKPAASPSKVSAKPISTTAQSPQTAHPSTENITKITPNQSGTKMKLGSIKKIV